MMLASTTREHMVLMESPQPSMCPPKMAEYTSFRSDEDGIWHENVAKCRWRRSQISNDPAVGFMADRNCTSTIWDGREKNEEAQRGNCLKYLWRRHCLLRALACPDAAQVVKIRTSCIIRGYSPLSGTRGPHGRRTFHSQQSVSGAQWRSGCRRSQRRAGSCHPEMRPDASSLVGRIFDLTACRCSFRAPVKTATHRATKKK